MLDSTSMRSIPARLWLLAIFSACLQLVPFPLAGPVPVWRRLACWFCLVPLLVALRGRVFQDRALSLPQAAALGYVCGVAWFFGNCYWIYQTMYLYGGLPAPAAFGILVLFSLYLGLYLCLFAVLFTLAQRKLGGSRALLLAPLLWVAVELARARITGFPWDLLGYTQVDDAFLTPMAPFTGVLGLSLIVAAGNVLWFWRPPAQRWRFAGPVAGVVVMLGSLAGDLYASRGEAAGEKAILLQDNLSVGVQEQSQPQPEGELLQQFSYLTQNPIREAMAGLDSSSSPAGAALLAWPEAPTPFADADPRVRQALAALARQEQAPLVVQTGGASTLPNSSGRYDQYVSASFFLPDGTYAGRYDKMHLVPFGEYTPYKRLFFFAGHLMDQLVLVPGARRRVFSSGGHRFGVFICYESIFGDEVRQFVQQGAQVLVNLSDDGWYGDTSAPWEHLDMARMRAIENRRWLLRDTNTGLTGSIDPQGRIVAALPRHVRAAVAVPFGYRSERTFYTRHGDWVAWLCAAIAGAALVGAELQRRFPLRKVD